MLKVSQKFSRLQGGSGRLSCDLMSAATKIFLLKFDEADMCNLIAKKTNKIRYLIHRGTGIRRN